MSTVLDTDSCSLVTLQSTVVKDCNDNDAALVTDQCVVAKLDELITLFQSESDETQSALTALQATIDDGVDVTALLDNVSTTAQSQLQALIEAALNASQPLQVELAGDTTALTNAIQAALTWAGSNVQFDVIATQNGTWMVDLSTATLAAINQAFDDALLDASPLDVNITNSGAITVALNQTSLDALENVTATIDGQPIDVNVVGSVPVDISSQSISDLATALDGLNVNATITGVADVNVATIDPSVLTELQTTIETALGNVNVDVTITNGVLSVSLDNVGTTALTQLQTMLETALGNVTVDVSGTVGISSQSISDLATALDGLNVNASISGNVQIDPASITALAQAIAGETLAVDITNQPVTITGSIDLGDVSALTDWLTANDLDIDDAAIIAAIQQAALDIIADDDTDDDIRPITPQCYESSAGRFLGYATVDELGVFSAWEVISGTTPTGDVALCSTCITEDRTYIVGCYPVLVRVVSGTDCVTGLETIIRATTIEDSGSVLTAGDDITADIVAGTYKETNPEKLAKVTVQTAQVLSGSNTISLENVTHWIVDNQSPAGVSISVNGKTVESGREYSADVGQNGSFAGSLIIEGGNYEVQLFKRGTPPCIADDVVEGTKVGLTYTVDTAANDTLCIGQNTTYTIDGTNNCTAVDNGDGTFDVTPAAGACPGNWSFNYTALCVNGSGSATVSGAIDDAVVTHAFSTANESTVNLNLIMSGGGDYDIDWGDGSTTTGISGSYSTHTYSALYTGDIIVTHSDCEIITQFRSTQGHWNFDIANLPTGLTYYNNISQNTTTGDIANLPNGLTTYLTTGQNTTTGDIANLPSGLTYYYNTGQNTTTGDIANLPNGLTYYVNTGNNTTTATTTNWLASTTFRYFYWRGVTKTQSEIDNVLVALTNVTSWIIEKEVDVAGVNAAPSIIGQNAASTITGNGATVITN